jgi:signal transduction histidine kinase
MAAFTATEVQALPPTQLLFHPAIPIGAEPAASVFAEGETAEYRDRNPELAVERYRRLLISPDPAIRAAAWLRIGRALRAAGLPDRALDAFRELARLGPAPVIGMPAELLGRKAIIEVLEEAGRPEDAKREGSALLTDLAAARWVLNRGQYEVSVETAARAAGLPPPVEGLEFADRIESLWTRWRQHLPPRGRELQRSGNRAFLVVWRATPDRLGAWVVDPAALVADLKLDPAFALTLSDFTDGSLVLGPAIPSGRKAIRTSADMRLPWTMHVARGPSSYPRAGVTRGQLVLGGFGLMLVFLAAGSYFIGRAVRQETELARLQADFVAAVSHEFRTPLAAMRQFSELLAAGRVAGDQKRQHYYESPASESRRLQRLVESLLNFGRLEAGARTYELAPIETRALVETVVSDYQTQLGRASCEIEVDGPPDGTMVMADRDAVALALHNLLDNAVKYSGGDRPVRIEWGRQGDRVAVSVRDHGPGLATEEQGRVFQKFVRGTAATSGNVRGTGIGLATVQLVAAGHGGEVSVRSTPGDGATFTLFLPAA